MGHRGFKDLLCRASNTVSRIMNSSVVKREALKGCEERVTRSGLHFRRMILTIVFAAGEQRQKCGDHLKDYCNNQHKRVLAEDNGAADFAHTFLR